MELTITLDSSSDRSILFGTGDRNLRLIRGALGVHISARDSHVRLSGDARAVGRAATVIDRLQRLAHDSRGLTEEQVADAIAAAAHDAAAPASPTERIDVYARNAAVVPKTEGQREYVEALASHDLTLCVGPAGTGKTYLAVAYAVSLLKAGQIQRIVLVRPAVEAGERLGFLPGDMQAKVNPYLRPLFDAMHDMMTFDQIKRFMQNDVIEVIPLAYMRGRTLNSAAVLLDEAQNTTVAQMLMFLTRMGHHSKMIVTGDDSQVDLDDPEQSGLIDAVRRLQHVSGVAVVRLDRSDIVRHKLVQKIVNAYGQAAAGRGYRAAPRPADKHQSADESADG